MYGAIELQTNSCLYLRITKKLRMRADSRRFFFIMVLGLGMLNKVCLFATHDWALKFHRNLFAGQSLFTNAKCPVDTCQITPNRDRAKDADLILYKDHYIPTGVAKLPRQLYMLYFLECPYHTQHIKFPDVFNWTSTYRFVTLIICFSISNQIQFCFQTTDETLTLSLPTKSGSIGTRVSVKSSKIETTLKTKRKK